MSTKQNQQALIIFTKNPELGKVKTRLAKTIGDNAALEIYKKLIDHTFQITKNLDIDKFVFYSNTIPEEDIWNDTIFQKKIQIGEDLGEKMQNAFKELFSLGYKNAIIIGSDIFDLKKIDLQQAFQKLNSYPFVIGPAEDGGYYLLGMNELLPTLFIKKNWGTNTVLENTLLDLKKYNTYIGDIRNDIDTYEDLIKFQELSNQILIPKE